MSDERVDESAAKLDSAELFSLLGRAHTLNILCEIVIKSDPPIRFNQLQERIDVSPNTLSRRLEELVDTGFLVRNSYDEIPPRVEYEPTEKLYALEPTFLEVEKWLTEYGDDEEFVLIDER
ncbi:winged helix-turn-helix transcriptional regulator [Natrarchaeobius sp. A-rgal3]|uniref:winged helix-turn-helix transcriptional regulator n=1 Tax=Natrarchaeobius versutus TaxID=1679078 RepID=UPI00350EC644